ncbi:uncharacterized protein TRIADDRAFT_61037 [Trichoplax adhaerens]|uniref:Ig-like domain-containing protein n=1 Tax=Trichoplax adhaerens TaxID=10228 RepID=B3S9V1_TRIAD|nr:hypothetical protein TRIADDRAFT_61037 [Trichoplax adhaerens]EDV20537.1 hypothetical protein TRIADDRAFT_61037 [Trichoplax adhaerens]|eukprot:XP_002116963.1 hypothetical protein TRIADDRAFT_61037 [Trichoplax adhaerens]
MRIVTTLLLFAVLVGTLPEQLQAALPTITLHPKSTTVIQDARVTISCQAFGASSTVIKWFKDGSLMPSSSFTKSYSFGRLSSQLTLSKASNSDQGSYRCEFSNTNEAVRSRSAT